MHRKEQVIAPILEEALGLQVEVSPGLDTDRFGTFTREVPRPGTQLATVRLKAQAALAAVPEAAFGLASEGSFGPHPWFPLGGGGRELIMLVARDAGIELVGADLTAETNQGSLPCWQRGRRPGLRPGHRVPYPCRGRDGCTQGETGCLDRRVEGTDDD